MGSCLRLGFSMHIINSILPADVVFSLSSSVYRVTESEGQVTFQVQLVKENETNVPIKVNIAKIFMDSALPDCPALGLCKLWSTILVSGCWYDNLTQ